jgi:isocitrate dehydrogenase kinase/phosphatase
MSAEPWYSVGDHDVFPEEFASFLGLSPDLRQIFLAHHGDLLDPEFWKRQQQHIQMGTWCHIRPYGRHQRLPHNRGPKATG